MVVRDPEVDVLISTQWRLARDCVTRVTERLTSRVTDTGPTHIVLLGRTINRLVLATVLVLLTLSVGNEDLSTLSVKAALMSRYRLRRIPTIDGPDVIELVGASQPHSSNIHRSARRDARHRASQAR